MKQSEKISLNSNENEKDKSKQSFCVTLPTLDHLTDKQKFALECMLSGKNIFLTGPAGTGKTTIISLFKKMVTDRFIGITSMTGISAILLGGSTMHSYLGIGLGVDSFEILFEKIRKNYKSKMKWIKTDVLIIDEISMLSPKLFEKLDLLGRSIREIDLPFGGIQLVLCGDFLQLPVIRNTSINSFCFESKIWNQCIDETIYLDEIVRQTDTEFQNVLNNVRMGTITEDTKQFLNSRIFKEEKKGIKENKIKPTRLYTMNKDVDAMNENELYKLNDGSTEFLQYDMKISFIPTNKNETDYLQKIVKNCPAPSELVLCKGAQVMLVYNMDVEHELANGSRGIVTGFKDDFPIVKFINGEERMIDFHKWEIEDRGNHILTITQIPLRLAWSLTIHKSQSCTLDLVEVDLSNVFEYGQAYVALSRVRNKEGLRILAIDYESIKAHPKAVKYYKNLKQNEKNNKNSEELK